MLVVFILNFIPGSVNDAQVSSPPEPSSRKSSVTDQPPPAETSNGSQKPSPKVENKKRASIEIDIVQLRKPKPVPTNLKPEDEGGVDQQTGVEVEPINGSEYQTSTEAPSLPSGYLLSNVHYVHFCRRISMLKNMTGATCRS